MNILVDNGTYNLHNMGDIAMLKVAVNRLKELWPESIVRVISNEPTRLKNYVAADTVSPQFSQSWANARLIPMKRRWTSISLQQRVHTIEDGFRQHLPRTTIALLNAARPLNHTKSRMASEFAKIVKASDLVIASGGGYLNDAFQQHTRQMSLLFDLAQHLGIRTAMVGQGLGPLENHELRELAERIWPKMDLIGLRERRFAPELLKRIGATHTNSHWTGDDAVELAYGQRRKHAGDSIGISLRMAKYSQINTNEIKELGQVIRRKQNKWKVDIRPLPISFSRTEADLNRIEEFLTKFSLRSSRVNIEQTPENICNLAASCRLVVTATYHAGVFALSQGIPIVGLVKSQYYSNKFEGLADCFPGGCAIVRMDGDRLASRLDQVIEEQWNAADDLRPGLLIAAQKQINAGQAAFRLLKYK
ncbi:Polysaccharide pyruvyl transferase [Symmachiella macrocystis]|uniref:Polysaccharide pyruvyl transferase n=2 Tax=Symmachiella macrocystis TaxID=2527985 RepID=A0A5C6B4V0_9PLAN|nr:Polysaccharide pyruvyl transferase [Symmachiella macrocystis]